MDQRVLVFQSLARLRDRVADLGLENERLRTDNAALLEKHRDNLEAMDTVREERVTQADYIESLLVVVEAAKRWRAAATTGEECLDEVMELVDAVDALDQT